MKKKIIIFIIIIICIFFGYKYQNRYMFESIITNKPTNVPKYIAIRLSNHDGPGYMSYDNVILVDDKTKQYEVFKEQDINTFMYDQYNDSVAIISQVNCIANIYYNNLKVKHLDLCEKTKAKNSGIQEMRFNDSYKIATFNGGFRDEMQGYQSGIGIYDKNYKLIDEIGRKNIIYSTALEDDNIFYLISGTNVADEETQGKSQVIKYNIKTKKEKIVYDIKIGKHHVSEIIPYQNKLYVIYVDRSTKTYCIGTIENGNIKKIKEIGYEYGSYDGYIINRDGDLLVSFPTVESKYVDEKSSLVKITKEGKVIIKNLIFPTGANETRDYIYYDVDDNSYRMNTITLKSEKINFPFPEKSEKDNYFIAYFNK